MGCDIHIITEVRKDGKWGYVPEVPSEFDTRNYGLFALFADVRNSFDTKGFKAKGLPEDISAMKFNFESYTENGKKRYEDSENGTQMFIKNDGTMKSVYDLEKTVISKEIYEQLEALSKVTSEEYSRRYSGLGWSQRDGEKTYFVYDAHEHDGRFEYVPYNKIYKTLEDFMAYMYEDEYDEERKEYGRYRVDFSCEDYHTPSYLSLKELLEGDYSDYFSNKYKMDKTFYDDFIALGGKLPEGMRMEEYQPSDFGDVIRFAFCPNVMIVWEKKDEDKENSALYKGISELKEIAEKYSVEPEDIRIVFAFDN